MKTRIARLVRSLGMSILFVLTTFSLLDGRGIVNPGLERVHMIAGALMLAGSLVHLATNADWIRSVFTRPAGLLTGRVRSLRRTNLWLFVSGAVCSASAAARFLDPDGPLAGRLAEIHWLSGLLMGLLLFIHLVQHWGWLMNTLRTLRRSPELALLESAAES